MLIDILDLRVVQLAAGHPPRVPGACVRYAICVWSHGFRARTSTTFRRPAEMDSLLPRSSSSPRKYVSFHPLASFD